MNDALSKCGDRGTQAEFLEKGKPGVNPGRKAMGLALGEIARPPKGIKRSITPGVFEIAVACAAAREDAMPEDEP